jgi:hypothetical protein
MKFKVRDENVGPSGLDLLRHVTHGLTAVAIEYRAFRRCSEYSRLSALQ